MVLDLPDLVNTTRHFFYLDVFRGLAARAVFTGHIRALFFQSFAEAGFSRIEPYSAEHGVTPKMYGDLELGREPKGSLVLELYK